MAVLGFDVKNHKVKNKDPGFWIKLGLLLSGHASLISNLLINIDPKYLEFLQFVSKPVENLPSAEIQLERKEAERAGAAKEAPIVTPLMDFVWLKKAAKGRPRVGTMPRSM
ncbi:regulator of nonsense transcripts UPF3-like [Helianthus annuus]|uniref:regulator of nonsense transcripts UPF3-like n=1 Tax=Helianthus annuus TaxID=4232 RepID=UPI001652C0DA|nr:regulator of nonsense transcripts UPF3-like [Helianthus annuus]